MRNQFLFTTILTICTMFFSASPASASVIYWNDFENIEDPLTEWSGGKNDITPGTSDRFLGEFGNSEATSLTLNDLPEWTEQIKLTFNLYIVRSWDGSNNWGFGPDIWETNVEGGEVLLRTTFSNCTASGFDQSYPGSYPEDVYPMRTRAVATDTLGYPEEYYGDAVYELNFQFSYSGNSTLTLNFWGSLVNTGSHDEAWGIDNIQVEATPEPATLLLLGLGGLMLRKLK